MLHEPNIVNKFEESRHYELIVDKFDGKRNTISKVNFMDFQSYDIA